MDYQRVERIAHRAEAATAGEQLPLLAVDLSTESTLNFLEREERKMGKAKKAAKAEKAAEKETKAEKAMEPEAVTAAAAEPTAVTAAAEPEKAAEPTALTLPEKTADLCIQEGYWETTEDIYDPNSGDCKVCGKNFPNQPAICAARTAYLASLKTKGKAAKKGGTKAVVARKRDGKLPQSVQIDEYLKEGMSLARMIEELANRDFGGDVAPSKVRVIDHLKAIATGRYCRAESMKPFLEKLSEEDRKRIGGRAVKTTAENAEAATAVAAN